MGSEAAGVQLSLPEEGGAGLVDAVRVARESLQSAAGGGLLRHLPNLSILFT